MSRDPATAILGQEGDDLRDVVDASRSVLHRGQGFLGVDEAGRQLVGELGDDDPRVDAVDRMPRGTEFRRPGSRQPPHGALGGGIGAEPGEADAGRQGADVDDSPGSPQVGDHGLGHQEEASHVEVAERGEVLGRRLRDAFDVPRPRVVDQDVDVLSECSPSGFDNLLGRFDLAEVRSHFDRGRTVVQSLDL